MPRAVFIILLVLLLVIGLRAQDEGAALFKANCARCHNGNGDGKTTAGERMKIPNLRSPEVQKLSDEQLFQTIGNGVQHKQYPHTFLSKGMKEGEIRKIVSHIRALAAKR